MAATARSPTGALAATVEPWHTLPGLQVARELHVGPATGLSTEEAASRLAEIGLNALPHAPAERRSRLLLRQYAGVTPVVLVAAAIGSLLLGDLSTALALLALTAANAVLGLRRDEHAPAAAGALAGALDVIARVRRDGRVRELAATRLVPGDLVRLEAGDVVPADGRLLEATALMTDESALTGRAMPAAKAMETVEDPAAPLGERADMVYMGTRVVRGWGEFVVTVTGEATEIGSVWRLLRLTAPRVPVPQPELGPLRRRMLALGALAVATAALIGLARGRDGDDVASAAIALAVAALPLSFPAVRSTLADRARTALASAGVEVRRLRALEVLGRVTAIAAAEPGSLTLAEPVAVELSLPGRRHTAAGGSFHRVGGEVEAPLDPILLAIALVADGEPAGAPVDGPLLDLAERGGLDVAATRAAHPRIADLPVDPHTGMSATFHRVGGAANLSCFVKGPPEQLLARASHALAPAGDVVPVDAAFRARCLEERARLAAAGLRVVAIARRDLEPGWVDPRADLLPPLERLTLLTLVGIADPPRPGTREAVAAARAAGIGVCIVTGGDEAEGDAAAAALDVAGTALSGPRLAALGESEAAAVVRRAAVLSRDEAGHALALVRGLERGGHVVAMAGAAVGDSPALQAAHVGIATSPAVADASALVVAHGGFPAIVHAIGAGRRLDVALRRAARLQASLAAGIVLAFVGAAALGLLDGLLLLPLQAVYLAFAVHLPLSLALASGPLDAVMDRPLQPLPRRRLLALLTTAGGAEAIAVLSVTALAAGDHDARTVRTMALVTLALVAVLLAGTVRDGARPAAAVLDAPRALVAAAAASLAAAVAAAQTGVLQRMLDTSALDFSQWLLCGGVSLAIVVTAAALRQIIRIR